MEYKATFGIDCGVSHGFGVKYPDYVNLDEALTANDDISAISAAAKLAITLSRDYLSNPKDNLTKVTLLELYDQKRNRMNIKEVLKQNGYDSIKSFEWDDDGKLITKCSMLEHLLRASLSEKIYNKN